jgi:hypothetical protein
MVLSIATAVDASPFHWKRVRKRLLTQYISLLNKKMTAMANWNFILCLYDLCPHFLSVFPSSVPFSGFKYIADYRGD